MHAESKEKHDVWDPIPELTIVYNLTLCALQSRFQHIYRGQPYARVDFIPQSGSLDLASGIDSQPGGFSILWIRFLIFLNVYKFGL
jgi:hypothetical protein